MRTLVIGTSGQLATELHRVERSASLELLAPRRVDIAARAELLELLDSARPQLVINASAYTAVDRAESEPARAHAVNADGPGYAARWCAEHGAALFHVSTDYVFDGSKTSAYTEEDVTNPLGAYGKSKLAGELALRSALAEHVILRTSWVFSAHGQNFVKTMLRLASERDELRVVADQHGRPTPAADLARALLELASRYAETRRLAWGTYHFAGAGSTTWHGFAEAVVEAQYASTKRRPSVTAIATADYPTPAVRPANSVLDTTRFENTFGYPMRSWRDGLADVIGELLPAS